MQIDPTAAVTANAPSTGQAQVISGTALAASIRQNIAARVTALKQQYPRFQPNLTIIQQGGRADSSTYVRMKERAAKEAGFTFSHITLSEDLSEEELLADVSRLNGDESVHGLLVQLPLSDKIGREGERRITEAVAPTKDVDG